MREQEKFDELPRPLRQPSDRSKAGGKSSGGRINIPGLADHKSRDELRDSAIHSLAL
jgi:hypothetical protein